MDVLDKPRPDQDATRELFLATPTGPAAEVGPVPRGYWVRDGLLIARLPLWGHAVAVVRHGEDMLWLEASIGAVEDWMPLGIVQHVASEADRTITLVPVADRTGTVILAPGKALAKAVLDAVVAHLRAVGLLPGGRA